MNYRVLSLATLAFVSPIFAAEPSATPKLVPTPVQARTLDQLVQGDSAEKVLQIMGKPLEVRPMKAPNGKAEVWLFEKRTHLSSKRIEVGAKTLTTQVQGADGAYREVPVALEPIFKTEQTFLVESIQVLVFNDLYVNHKATSQKVTQME